MPRPPASDPAYQRWRVARIRLGLRVRFWPSRDVAKQRRRDYMRIYMRAKRAALKQTNPNGETRHA